MARQPDNRPANAAEAADLAREERRRRHGRIVVLALAWLKSALAIPALLFAVSSPFGHDPAGAAVSAGLPLVVVGYWCVFVLPAFLFARKGRLIGFCFALLVLPDLLAILAIAAS